MAEITIIMPLWNKERYIAEALDSVFRQRTSRSYRIVVADDHSTDRSLEIVADYDRRHPGVITVLRSDANLKLFRNIRRAYEITDTPYFCVLDPDDYWLDDLHLEKAVGFLEAHPGFTIYSAGIERLERDGSRVRCTEFPETEADSDFDDYLTRQAVIAYTQTCVYRNVVFARGLPEKVRNPPTASMEQTMRGDSFRNFLHIREGKAHFSPSVEACYRITDDGVYQGQSLERQLFMNARFYSDMWAYDDRRHDGLLEVSRWFERAAERLASIRDGDADAPAIRLYWVHNDNFGDAVSPMLVERIAGCACAGGAFEDCNLSAIGSLFGNGADLMRRRKWYYALPFVGPARQYRHRPLVVWGSGFWKYPPDFTGCCPNRRLDIRAVRGTVTSGLLRVLGVKVPDKVRYGDPGLLFPRLLDDRFPATTEQIGLIAHYRDKDAVRGIVAGLKAHGLPVHFIDVQRPPVEVISDIAACRAIASTSMHGCIAADSFGIPNVHFRVSNLAMGEADYLLKFKDYYSAFGIDYDVRIRGEDILAAGTRLCEFIRRNSLVSRGAVKEAAEGLEASFPRDLL